MAFFYHIVALLGGLAMFLYGMRVMGDGLKSNSGGAMKTALETVTSKPFLGFILGMLVTCIIQSSTATIVLTVGLVGAGLLTFRQSVGVVLGANVGTAITAQIIRLMDVQSGENSIMYFFKADNLAPMALIIGIVLLMACKSQSQKNMGNVACGFGVLFMGLIFMSDAVSSFESSLSYLLTAFENNYLLGFGAGVVVTGVIQSSSAVVGIIQSIASSVGVTFKGIFTVIIGVNIGDCLTTFLVSRIGARPEQIRTAVVHVVYNVLASILVITLVFIGKTTGLLDNLWMTSLNAGGVANLHGLFRMIPAITLLPFSGFLAKITEKIVPDKPVEMNEEDAAIEEELKNLDSRLITSPILALDQVKHLISQMAAIARHNYTACSQQIYGYEEDRNRRINEREDLLDRCTDATNQYLVSLTPYIARNRDFRMQNFQMKASVCIERIGDHAVELTRVLRQMEEAKKIFSESAMLELRVALDAVDEIIETTVDAFNTGDINIAKRVEPLEEVVDDLIDDLNSRHMYRVSRNACDAIGGILYQNMLNSLENIADQCSDIAIYLIELEEKSIIGREHEYIHQLHHSNDATFQEGYQQNREKYFTRLFAIPTLRAEMEDMDTTENTAYNTAVPEYDPSK